MIVNLAVDKISPVSSIVRQKSSAAIYRDARLQQPMDGIRTRISETAAKANGSMQKDVEQAVGNYLYSETHRRPMIFVNVV